MNSQSVQLVPWDKIFVALNADARIGTDLGFEKTRRSTSMYGMGSGSLLQKVKRVER